jgi:hypothetical protein
MPDKKQPQYPIRLDIGAPGAAKALPARAQGRTAADMIQTAANRAALDGFHAFLLTHGMGPMLQAGLGIPAMFASRMQASGGQMPPKLAQKAADTSQAVPVAVPDPTVATPLLQGIHELFPGMKQISLGQLAALSGAFGNTLPALAKQPVNEKDRAGAVYQDLITNQYNQEVAAARANPDPTASATQEATAYEKYLKQLSSLAIPNSVAALAD